MSHKVGDVIAFTKYAKVNGVAGNTLKVKDLHSGCNFEIIGQDIQNDCLSADNFATTKDCTKTELASILAKSNGSPFTVVFDTADGDERLLRGRLLSSEDLLGRSKVEDLDLPDGKRVRQVDHRTIKSIVWEGIKYILKGHKNE